MLRVLRRSSLLVRMAADALLSVSIWTAGRMQRALGMRQDDSRLELCGHELFWLDQERIVLRPFRTLLMNDWHDLARTG